MQFNDIVLDVFKTGEKPIKIEEGILLTNPFLAMSVFKDKILKKLRGKPKKEKGAGVRRKKGKSGGLLAKEKAKAKLGVVSGKGEGATVYKLTPEQKKVFKEIYAKYGNDIVKSIKKFRSDILAPAALINRIIKKSSRIGSKDITGMTRDQFNSALESGRKKIQARGEGYWESSKELRKKLNDINDSVKALSKVKSDFVNGRKPDQNVLTKVYNKFDVSGKDFGNYATEDLRRMYNAIIRNHKEKIELLKKMKTKSPSEKLSDKSRELRMVGKELWTGKPLDLTKQERDEFYGPKGVKFNIALGKYFFRREILDKLKPGQSNIFRKTYLSIVDEMKKNAEKRRKNHMEKLIASRKAVEFNRIEKKIWEKLPTVKTFSNKLEDYYQKIKEEDFLEKSINIKRSPKLIAAKQSINNEIKRFERKLGQIVTAEDLAKLKKYRLINNLISVGELEEPSKLFKSSGEIESDIEREYEEEPPEDKEEYISRDSFIRRIKEIATIEFDTYRELTNAKKEAKELVRIMKEQGDEDAVKEHKDILKQIEMRRTTEAKKMVGHRFERETIIDIDDVEAYAKKILNTKYKSYDMAKQAYEHLQTMVSDYKERDPEDAKKNLGDIETLLDKVKFHMTRELEV